MQLFLIFPNNHNVRANTLIASQLGVTQQYEEAMKLFNWKNEKKHGYVCIRKDLISDNEPDVLTNLFGELLKLGRFPWWFEAPPRKKYIK
jgi:hypothetical protein